MVLMEYKGNDPRLEYGASYNCTVNKPKGTDRVYVSAHTSIKGRVYKQYSTPDLFLTEWKEVGNG